MAPFTSDVNTSDSHLHANAFDGQSAEREFMQAVYETSNLLTDAVLDYTTLYERFLRANGIDRPLTSDHANFDTYLDACARGGNTTTGFP